MKRIQWHQILESNIVFIVFALLVLFVYHNGFNHDFILYDDQVYINDIANNDRGLFALVKWALVSVVNSNWHPLTVLSLSLDYKLYGLDAGGYHATSLILHYFNVCLVFLITYLLIKDRSISFIAACVFALHPVNVEAVAWIAERKGVLAAFFALATIYTYLLFSENRRKTYYFLAGLFLLFALLSKAVFVTLPLVFIIFDVYFQITRKTEIDRRFLKLTLLRQAPFLFISFIIGIVTVFAHSGTDALGVNQLFDIGTRVAKAVAYYPVYIGQFFYPVELIIPYPYRIPSTLEVIFGFSFILTVSIAAIRLREKLPLFFLGWFWYLVLLLPVSGLLQSGYFSHADRYAYLPLIGLILIVVPSLKLLFKKLNTRSVYVTVITTLLITGLGLLSYLQHAYWKNTVTLFHHAYTVDKNNYLANTYLSVFYIKIGKYEEGLKHYRLARNSSPTYLGLYNKVMNLLLQAQQYNLASNVINDVYQVIKHIHEHKNYNLNTEKYNREVKELLQVYAGSMMRQENYNEVLQTAEQGLKIMPVDTTFLFFRAYASFKTGNYASVLQDLNQILKIQPDYYHAHVLLIQYFVQRENTDAALQSFNTAVTIFPERRDELSRILTMLPMQK